MTSTHEQLLSFQQFASHILGSDKKDLTLPEIFSLWLLDNPSASEQSEVNQIIKKGEKDRLQEKYRSLDNFMNEFREKHKIQDES